MHHCIEIRKYQDAYRQELITIWKESVLATHNFLKTEDFIEIRAFVESMDFSALEVYCLVDNEAPIGFMGVADQKLEMLFLHPDHFGKGFGKNLMNFAVQQLQVNTVDVNEQNVQAVLFYKKYGFEEVERTMKDDQGRNYPLIRMKLPAIFVQT